MLLSSARLTSRAIRSRIHLRVAATTSWRLKDLMLVEAEHLGARLPVSIRGFYYEGWLQPPFMVLSTEGRGELQEARG